MAIAGPAVHAPDYGVRIMALGFAGRRDEARVLLARMAAEPRTELITSWITHLGAWLDRRITDDIERITKSSAFGIFRDPEAIFQEAWILCDLGEHARALPFLERAVSHGYFAATTLAACPQFDALRDTPAFQSLLTDAEAGRERAMAAFVAAGGERLLGR
jgi:hypothetical protein